MAAQRYGTYGFRFTGKEHLPLYSLFALGYDRVTGHYEWDGMKRIDGPLYLFQYTLSGRGRLQTADAVYDLRPQQAFLVDIPSVHRYDLPPDSEGWEFYFILMRQHPLGGLREELKHQLGTVFSLATESPAIRVLQGGVQDAAAGRINDAYAASSLVYRFMMELARTANRPKEEQWPPAIREAAQYLTNHFGEAISIDDAATAAGLSKFHFTRLFTRTTGYTPGDYLTRIRIVKGAEYLRNSTITIDEVARRCGFAGGSYFSKVFRQWVGCTPGDYRSGKEVLAANHLIFD
ncbi:AraC-like DNA-binding protein [Paenibacillus phyllosphaerae]|uniref:AraC-like DNA-binding protein n=1 Tax=Paenibacillus phyllosphaerae TaxID=274593 RepID=A0A7W5FM12_9BACL|nr:AraC family transcriptional regulator [Paenibacillus phyllosphaerae]MBB3109810.1 AraC-like DNA-binding protein [Paenibacillus phyllosphaerae]